ncbi:MAG: hypothetical protein SCARUB_04875 [Candidatus Scalindua rubra]|uniref:HicB-like antitoxin of toxin-antitoxin system domain-containing protein n=1 Tax=Candidatus Scalindua rubra TaxID=1872076 RepID=A0A1E3X2Z3_9BACT|nr:MAG: hypothetical protein SCARUB_04875 [Candidatus Scalindua rubra]
MKPIKTLTGRIEKIPHLHLHILLTEEDGVIVARCLDFSVSSHGENVEDALASLSDAISSYLDHAIKHEAMEEIIDPDEEVFWKIYRELELRDESLRIKESADVLKVEKIKDNDSALCIKGVNQKI